MDILLNDKYDLVFKDGDFVSTETKFPDYELLQQFRVALTCERSSYAFNSELGIFIENLKQCESLAQVNTYLSRALRSLLSDQIYSFQVDFFSEERNQLIMNLDITTQNDTYSLSVGFNMPISKSGFILETQTEIRNKIKTQYQNSFGENVAVDNPNSIVSQFFEQDARQAVLNENTLSEAYASLFIDTAEGQQLDFLGQNANIDRILSTGSTTVLRLTGDFGTILPEGFRVSKPIAPVIIFETLRQVEIGVQGFVDVEAQSLSGGSQTNLNIGQINNIINPLAGLSSVENINPSVGGGEAESDEDYRIRYKNLTSMVGNFANFRKRLLQIQGVSFVDIIENTTLFSIFDIPALAVTFLIEGGTATEIGQAFADLGAMPFRTYGQEKVVVQNSAERSVDYYFTRPSRVEITSIKVFIQKFSADPLTALFLNDFKNQIVSYINSIPTARRVSDIEVVAGTQSSLLKNFPEDWNNIENITMYFESDSQHGNSLVFKYFERPFTTLEAIEIEEVI